MGPHELPKSLPTSAILWFYIRNVLVALCTFKMNKTWAWDIAIRSVQTDPFRIWNVPSPAWRCCSPCKSGAFDCKLWGRSPGWVPDFCWGFIDTAVIEEWNAASVRVLHCFLLSWLILLWVCFSFNFWTVWRLWYNFGTFNRICYLSLAIQE